MAGGYIGSAEEMDADECWLSPKKLQSAAAHMSCDACSKHIRIGDQCAMFYRADVEHQWDLLIHRNDWDDLEDSIFYVQCSRCFQIFSILEREHNKARTHQFVDPRLACGHEWSEFFDHPMPEELIELAFQA